MPSKAGKFATEAEALGWTVERLRLDGGTRRRVKTSRGTEQFNFTWIETESGAFVLQDGWHWIGQASAEWTNINAALRVMAKPPPLDLKTATDREVIDYVRGKVIAWTNSMSGLEESAYVPPNGRTTRILDRLTSRRILEFASPQGFRAVAVNAITKVG